MIDAANQSDVAVGYRYLTLAQTFIMVVLAVGLDRSRIVIRFVSVKAIVKISHEFCEGCHLVDLLMQ